jgi:hypothetical protein
MNQPDPPKSQRRGVPFNLEVLPPVILVVFVVLVGWYLARRTKTPSLRDDAALEDEFHFADQSLHRSVKMAISKQYGNSRITPERLSGLTSLSVSYRGTKRTAVIDLAGIEQLTT